MKYLKQINTYNLIPTIPTLVIFHQKNNKFQLLYLNVSPQLGQVWQLGCSELFGFFRSNLN
jgi:hypothetical protein